MLLFSLLRDGFWLSLFGLLSYGFLFNLSVVRGTSMAPGISDGDRILIETWATAAEESARGGVVVLNSPIESGVDYIKRLIALPGDVVQIAGGRVEVNGTQIEEAYAIAGSPNLFQWTRVAPGHVFVLGDNRPHSSDSREFGAVPVELIRGRVNLRVWPVGSAGHLD